MRFIGGKTQLLEHIDALIKEKCPGRGIFCDIFSGSGAVARYFKPFYEVICNDQLYFSYAILKGCVENAAVPAFDNLRTCGIDDVCSWLENTPISCESSKGFIAQNYAPNENCTRMYLTAENAARIDFIRSTIENWRKDGLLNDCEYFYLLACLIEGVPYVSNITGTYGAYLKHWDKRALKKFELPRLEVFDNGLRNAVYNEDANTLIETIAGDVLYIDPPYNSRQYAPNYHLLETLARYDAPPIKGVTGMRPYDALRSRYCQKKEAAEALGELIAKAKFAHIVLSYSSDGLISAERIEQIMKSCGLADTFQLQRIPSRKYKSKIYTDKPLEEFLFYIRKKTQTSHLLRAASSRVRPTPDQGLLFPTPENSRLLSVTPHAVTRTKRAKYLKSPLNYIGGKYKILNQLVPLFPQNIETFADVFSGGCNVAVNVPAKRTLCCDINSKIIGLMRALQERPVGEILAQIERQIQSFQLSKENAEGFLRFRDFYNSTGDPVDLYTLTCFSFNYQFRFNNNLEYNNPFGRNRSRFSETMRAHLVQFIEKIRSMDIRFLCGDFEQVELATLTCRDFIYCDPPYLITTGSYNDGNRGFKNWTVREEERLYAYLDEAHRKKIRFALSNVLEHKGKINEMLCEWAKRYHVVDIRSTYANSSYNTKRGESREVVILNYDLTGSRE